MESHYAVIKKLPLLMHCLPCNRDEVNSSPSRCRDMLYHRHQVDSGFGLSVQLQTDPKANFSLGKSTRCLFPPVLLPFAILLNLFKCKIINLGSASYLLGPHWRRDDDLWPELFAFITSPLPFLRCKETYQTRLQCCIVPRYL